LVVMRAVAAHPPFSSKSESRNSFTHISPQRFGPEPGVADCGFRIPIIIARTLLRFGVPLIVIRVPGGAAVAKLLASLGFVVSAIAIVLACVPADDEPYKMFAVVKVVGSSAALVAIGAMIYFMGTRRS